MFAYETKGGINWGWLISAGLCLEFSVQYFSKIGVSPSGLSRYEGG